MVVRGASHPPPTIFERKTNQGKLCIILKEFMGDSELAQLFARLQNFANF